MVKRKGKPIGSAKASRRKTRKKKGMIAARKKKEFTYRGFTVGELQEKPLEEVIALLPARPRRNFKRGLSEDVKIFLKMLESEKKDVVRTHRRDIVVLPSFVGRKIAVYNGKAFVEITVQPEMIGHYLGEFSMTRKRVAHSGPGVGATKSSKFMPLK